MEDMEEVAFQDWPGPPVDLNSGNNPWLPAYGFQTPSALLEKEDFIGNPDAEYFISGSSTQYTYLETIQEETSDDLRSNSDVESRYSPVGWLATDSEEGSAICTERIDDAECDSDRELACPPKRRKQDCIYLLQLPEDETCLSRSSSLLQFETLEKECQQDCQSTVLTQFDFDELSPLRDDSFKSLTGSKQSSSRDSLLYNASTKYSSSDSGDSDTTIENSKSCDNLKTWRSFDSLLLANGNVPKKFSSENLSEDSGYGEQMLSSLTQFAKTCSGVLSSSAGNLPLSNTAEMSTPRNSNKKIKQKKNSYVGFGAYDCDVFQTFNTNFGVSYQDLTSLVESHREPKSSPLTDVFLRKKQLKMTSAASTNHHQHLTSLNLDLESGYSESSKFSENVSHASSVPNRLQDVGLSVDILDYAVPAVSSVPKDLNFLSEFNVSSVTSVAEQNLNLADLNLQVKCAHSTVSANELLVEFNSDDTMANYRREGSYSEAMSHRVDLSDDESSLIYKPKLTVTPIVDFDRRVLKAISEQSIQSLISSTQSLQGSQNYLNDIPQSVPFLTSTPTINRSVALSTPNLNRFEPVRRREKESYFDDDRRRSTQEMNSSRYDTEKIEEQRRKNILSDDTDDGVVEIRRKGSIIKSSTSTSGMSDIDEKSSVNRHSVKSFSGSNGSKGVHFSPVVAEVNWKDDASTSTVTPDRESLCSLNSSSPELRTLQRKVSLVKPKPQYALNHSRRSVSQPDISDTETRNYEKEYLDSLNNLRIDYLSKSQPDVSKLKRRGSQLIKKDKDGFTVKAYVDVDGIQYRHTHLGINTLRQTSLSGSNPNLAPKSHLPSAQSTSSKSLTSKFPFYDTNEDVQPSNHQTRNVQSNVVGEMDGRTTTKSTAPVTLNGNETHSKRKSGLGGFLQRLASFRLGAKKGHAEGKQKVKRKTGTQGNGTPATVEPNPNLLPSAKKPDYIYIPLKGQTDNNNSTTTNVGGGPVVAKPPLPKQPPPRVVHASVKKATHASSNIGSSDERRRRRTIDSAENGGVVYGVVGSVEGRRGGRFGNASMEDRSEPMGLIETDLDTEVTVITNGASAKARSLLDLGYEPRYQVPQKADGSQSGTGRPHKSMEFLLDKENLKVVEPPENELQKTERVMSEHELRVQRSLQKLTVPEWYKNSQVPGQGFLLKKREPRWMGTSSKTTSLSSLGSGTQSPLVLSPTPTQSFVRWSTSKLNSTASSPCQSTRSSFNQGRQPNGSISPSSARTSFNYRQPYLGWRSQERLNRPRTPAERLASTLLSKQPSTPLQQESPEIQTSIKEVTSAIVHYVSGLKPAEDNLDGSSRRSSSISPRGSQKLCWLESSFVGTKPIDSPETPVTCSASPVPPPPNLRLELQNHSSNDLMTLSVGGNRVMPSPSSTTLEDVLDSLLGLPSSGRAASPCLQETVSASTSPQRRASDSDANNAYRRRSEGSEPASAALVVGTDPTSLAGPVLLRCRYSRCGKTALPSSKEAKSFKNCHNCSYTYCSRSCRRSHWERHRKTCLFSRMGTLCRQVIQAVKDQKETLKELSMVARRGYISHGLGAVKCFYPNPEAAENFLANALHSLGELTFVRWQDLLPTEMGPILYKELVEMCQNYNPETKFVLYISLCVVSETPASGAIKWERQLVSRCAKLRLSKDISFIAPERDTEPPETLILTCPPIRLPTPEMSMRARLIAVNNLQAQLRDRGVSLKRHYPELSTQLEAYKEDIGVKFETQTIYPHNITTNKSFMCIVMLETDVDTLKNVEKAGVKVRTVDCLLSCETTT